VTNGSAGQEIVFLDKGDGTFLPPVTSTCTTATYSVTNDLDGDGNLDLALNTGYLLLRGETGHSKPTLRIFGVRFPCAADVMAHTS
jgi:hypothetical protein